MARTAVHRFGPCELDETRRELRRDGQIVSVTPRVFDLLACLVRESHRVVPHAELCSTVWNQTRVAPEAMHACISRARRAIGDRDTAHPLIRSFARYGYRFVGEVDTLPDAQVRGPSAASTRHAGNAHVRLAKAATVEVFGRDAERSVLAAALEAAKTGRGRLAVVLGEYGIGKTCLGLEIAQRAAADGFEVLSGHALPAAPPFSPWAQVVREYCARHDPDDIRAALGSAAGDLAHIAPAVGDRCPELAAAPTADAAHAELRVHESLLAFVARAALIEPLLILLDDMQWADAASQRVLTHLAADLGHTAAVVLVLAESESDDTEWPALLGPAAAGAAHVRVELKPVDSRAARALMEHRLGRAVAIGFARRIFELTAGNPLVMLDTLNHLASAGLLPPAQLQWPSRAVLSAAGVAPSTCAMVDRRLERLDAACRRVLRIAAVAGDAFSFTTVGQVAALAGDDALPAIEAATRSGVIHPTDRSGDGYRFHAPYVPAAIRQRLNPTRHAHLRTQLASVRREVATEQKQATPRQG